MAQVYVPNKSFHDFSGATQFGELIFLTEGILPLHSVNTLYRTFDRELRESTPDDYLLVSGPAILNAIVASVLSMKHGSINFLLYDRKRNRYRHERISFQWSDILSSE